MPDPITRFAPSPTGSLHIGGARTALFCWAYAQGQKGRFLIRIEDTDHARSSEASTRGILEDLAWLGIPWDDGPEHTPEPADDRPADRPARLGGDERGVGPYFQAQRLDLYNQHIERLIQAGRAYPAFETTEQLDAARKEAIAQKRAYRYNRAALDIPEAERLERMKTEPHVIRFRMPDEPVVVRDEVLGEVSFAPEEADDFIIRKRDGYPTYHFAVVVDDELMGVTHVLRGQEHLNNSPRHVALQEALGFRIPVYAHMPLIFNADGSKMSKRDKDKAARDACKAAGLTASPTPAVSDADFAAWLKDKRAQLPSDALLQLAEAMDLRLPEVDVADFRRAGYLPEVLCNFIALLGWSPGDDIEKFDSAFLAERFDLKRIGKTNARFDRVKLLSFNTDAITALEPAEFLRRFRGWCRRYFPTLVDTLDPHRFELLAQAVQPRCKTFRDAADQGLFILADDSSLTYDDKAVDKALRKGDPPGTTTLAALAQDMQQWPAETFDDVPALNAAVKAFAEAQGIGMGKAAQPLRVALTGTAVSPPIDATLAILGRDRALTRINACLKRFPPA